MNDFLRLFRNWDDIVELPAGTEFVSEGDAATQLFVILAGDVELSLRGKSLGRETAGGIIGETAMLPGTVENSTLRAVTAVKLARLDSEQFYRLISENPAFSKYALLCMANRLRAANTFISTHLEDRD